MDDITATLADFATGFRSDSLTAPTIEAYVDHIVDCLGCAVAGAREEPAKIARALAAEDQVAAGGASAIGLEDRATVEQATFANAVAARCLDFNDTFQGDKTGGHPSDMLAALLAAAEVAGLGGRAVIDGMFVAYEVFGVLADQVPLREHGIDQGALLSVAVAAALSTMLGLSRRQAANAISLAITTTHPLRATRAGELSVWKGCATPHAVANAVGVTRLAARGMEGPPQPFRGIDGFLQHLPIDIDLDRLGRSNVIARTGIKFLPVEWGAQAPVELFMDLRKRIALDDIRAITIAGSDFLVKEIGGGRGDAAEKWDPQTRETADHSLPYLLAVTLMDGEVTLDSFAPVRVRDPALRPLMRKMKVVLNPAVRDLVPPRQPMAITIALADGRVVEESCEYALGHPLRPGDRATIDAKFRRLVGDALGPQRTDSLLDVLRGLASARKLDELTAALRAVPAS
jgi:2-methylcitrate dehydratase